MTTLNINGKEYKIKFGYNSFCDTDLMDRVAEMSEAFADNGESQKQQIEKMKEIFVLTRDLLYFGFQKYNPVKSIKDVGDLLDEYIDEKVEGEERGIMQLFTMITHEIMEEGFLSEMTKEEKK